MADQDCPSTQASYIPEEGAVSKASTTKGIVETESENRLRNVPAPKIPYFTPLQPIPSGIAIVHHDNVVLPRLFQPIKLRGLTLQNRIIVSPMCQYSADNGHMTDWHLTHLGGIIQRGPGLTIIEATAVTPEGRITPEDAGLWQDSQIAPLKRIVDFAHSQGQYVAIQLSHAGRKASTVTPWIDRKAAATPDVGGWPGRVISTSNAPYDKNTCIPRAMTLEDIASFKNSFISAVYRALRAGVDAIEIHAAHGYLLHSTLSSATNRLPAPYSGTLENRMRLLLELSSLTRAVIPPTMPFIVRIPGSDWMSHDPSVPAWDINQCVQLAKALAAPKIGVDFLDITSGGLMAEQKIASGPGYQVPFSSAVKRAVQGTDTLVGVVGMIRSGTFAEELLHHNVADVVLAGRAFLKNPGLVWEWAEELGVETRVANQIGWGFGQRAGGGLKGEKPVVE